MIPLQLTAAQQKLFHQALREPGTYSVDVALLTLEGVELSRISPVVLDGQVDVDADADVTRSCTVTFSDPSHSLQLDSDSPDDGALYADRMLRVIYSVRVPGLDDRVDVPVFTGPIIAFDRSGDEVTVDALGKEELGLNPIWRPLQLKKGMTKVAAIESLLRERAGETDFDLPELTTRLPRTISLGRMAQAWRRAYRIADSMNRQLYYDGAGVCRLRRRPRRPVFTFNTGDDGVITSAVQVSHDFTKIRNAIWLKGGKPKGAKKSVHAIAVAPRSHPLSPWRLGRNGDPRYLVEEITNDNVRSKREAQRRADELLEDRLTEVVGTTFTSAPIMHLDPLDLVRVVSDDFVGNVRLRQFSLPLGASGEMTVGYIDRVSKISRRKIRRQQRRRARR